MHTVQARLVRKALIVSVLISVKNNSSLQTTPPIITTYAEESSYLYFVLLFLMIDRISKLVCSGKVD